MLPASGRQHVGSTSAVTAVCGQWSALVLDPLALGPQLPGALRGEFRPLLLLTNTSKEGSVSTEAVIEISVDRLAQAPSALPDRCVRHGLPAVRRVDLAVRSRPAISRRRRLLVPGYTAVNRAEEYTSQVKVIRVRDWPLCADCARTHTVGVALASVLFFGGLAAMVISFIVGGLADGAQPLLAVPLIGGFAAMLAAVVPLRWGSFPRLTQAWTSDDGGAVRVADPHPEFTARLPGVPGRPEPPRSAPAP